MSIFKETFRKFVSEQLQIREAVVSTGNNNEGRINRSKNVVLKTQLTGNPLGYYFHSQNFVSTEDMINLIKLHVELEITTDPGIDLDIIIVNSGGSNAVVDILIVSVNDGGSNLNTVILA